MCFFFFFFNDTATTEIYTLSLHDALPIFPARPPRELPFGGRDPADGSPGGRARPDPDRWLVRLQPLVRRFPPLHARDRKSTRLNSSHSQISYAVFCLKKKK